MNKYNISYWNYRIIEYDENNEDHKYCAIHEVFYDKKDKIKGYTKEAIEICGNDKNDLMETLLNMLCDIRKYSILKLSKLKKICKEK